MIKIESYDKEKQKLSFTTDMNESLANAIRRSSLEIPILAIDEVEFFKNDSALYDEIIAHRLGLIPLKTDKTVKETKFKLKEKGPKTVYSTDLTPPGTSFKIPIVILGEGQELELEAEARLGKGIEHLKYSPGLVYYKHDVEEEVLDFITIDDEGKVTYDEEEIKEANLPEELVKKIKNTKEVKRLIFFIESWGQLEVKEIFLEAIEALQNNLKELTKAVK